MVDRESPERTDEAARRLALPVASASVEVIRIPVMDLPKIRDLPALAHACFLDPTTAGTPARPGSHASYAWLWLALPVASASVEVIRIPVMDLPKITDAHRLKALGIQLPKRIFSSCYVVLASTAWVTTSTTTISFRTSSTIFIRAFLGPQWLLFCGYYF
jgi:hypothetical protein